MLIKISFFWSLSIKKPYTHQENFKLLNISKTIILTFFMIVIANQENSLIDGPRP